MSRIAVALLLACSIASAQEGRTKSRLLYGFEAAGEEDQLKKFSESIDFAVVADNGVTEGSRCVRLVGTKGAGYCTFQLGAAASKGWADFDYFALDVFVEDDHPYPITFELWDAASKNYPTRCSFEGTNTRPGRQTLMWRINRAKRNGKEGRDWDELEPKDKIDMNGLTRVKIFFTPRKDRDTVMWIDNLRLLQEDAAKPKMKLPLPAGAIAFDFGSGSTGTAGFTAVAPAHAYTDSRGWGFASTQGLVKGGEGRPDPLSGTFILAGEGQPIEFRAKVPDGKYHVWVAAGPIIKPGMQNRIYKLTAGDKTIVDENPSDEEFNSEKYLYRFLQTQYSERPHAAWLDYIDRMYPTHRAEVNVTGGVLALTAVNHFVSGLVIVPGAASAEFDAFVTAARTARIAAYEAGVYAPARKKPTKAAGDGDYVLYVPEVAAGIGPDTAPSDADRKRTALDAAGCPGQRVVMRVAVTPFADLGSCTLELGDLSGPGKIPASQIRGHFQNYRPQDRHVGEMILLPRTTLNMEAGVTQCFWLWLHIPETAPAGAYKGTFTFKPARGEARSVPVSLEVHPFTLERDLPLSLGMYYSPRHADAPPAHRRKLIREQLEFMREVGFTGVGVGGPGVVGLGRDGAVNLKFDPLLYELGKEAGMGRRPEQRSMAVCLGVGRGIGRRLPGSQGATVDRNPGIELKQPEFRRYFVNAMTQYRDFIDKMGLPVAMEVVDEPREVPNPWNRNLADSISYANMLHEVKGLVTFIDPMGDTNSGKDYTVLVDHVDIMSTHAWKGSQRLMRRTHEAGKTLWLYNTGMDRFSWGFYNWRVGSQGRWEWHFCFTDDSAVGDYPGREWYNPFTSMHGFACDAPPATHRGGILYSSKFLTVCEGINDSAYLHTLEVAIKAAKAAGRDAETVKQAEEFLAALKRVIPFLPGVKGLGNEADGALVGTGIDDDGAKQVEQWRSKIAGFLKVLKKPA